MTRPVHPGYLRFRREEAEERRRARINDLLDDGFGYEDVAVRLGLTEAEVRAVADRIRLNGRQGGQDGGFQSIGDVASRMVAQAARDRFARAHREEHDG